MSGSETVRSANIHGTGVVLDGTGVLLRGPSGAGKSLLALALLDHQALLGAPGLLVADDRVDLAVEEGGLVMRTPTTIAGLVELRGRGIVRRAFVEQARLHLVVDLVEDLVRMVEEYELRTDLLEVTLPRCPVPRRGVVDVVHQLLLVDEAVRALDARLPSARQKTT